MPGKKLNRRRIVAALTIAAALAAAIPATGAACGSGGAPLAMEGGGVGP